jgi:nucleoside-diphosphate-sugar epimerase
MEGDGLKNLVRDKTFLVTGASGFIGNSLCSMLLESGATVHGTSRRNVAFNCERFRHFSVDLADSSEVDELFAESRPQYVIHLASCVTGRREIDWVRETMRANLLTTVNVLVASESSGVSKTVLAGSLEEPDSLTATAVPASPYAAAKWASAAYARMMHALYDTRVSVARIFMVYGPGQQDLKKLVPYVCLSAAEGKAPKLMSGDRPVDWIFIDDVIDGLIRMVFRGPDDGSYVDLGSGKLVTTGDVATRICEIASNGILPQFGALPDRAMEQVRKANADDTLAAINWTASTDLKSGLKRTYDWYKEFQRIRQEDGTETEQHSQLLR